MSIENKRNVLIVGGGISGLTAQFELENKGLSSLLIESTSNIGGKIKTIRKALPQGDIVAELGPDSFVPNKDTFELLDSLNLKEHLLKSNKLSTGIVSGGKVNSLPNGFYFMVPTAAFPFLKTRLISWKGKIRAALELFQRSKTDDSDESIAQFVRRRFGDEMLQKLVKPLIRGIFSTDPELQSVSATLPRFSVMEKKYGSLLLGMLRSNKRSSSAFLSFDKGMDEIVNALHVRNKENIHINTSLSSFTRTESGMFEVKLSNNQKLIVDKIIFATPPNITAKYLENISPQTAEILRTIRQKQSRLYFYAYPRKTNVLNHTGLLFDRDIGIYSISFSSLKFGKRSPEDILLVRASCDTDGSETQLEEHIRILSSTSSGPSWSYKSDAAMPIYEVGHREKIKRLYSTLPKDIFLCGNGYEGTSVPDCISLARRVALSIM